MVPVLVNNIWTALSQTIASIKEELRCAAVGVISASKAIFRGAALGIIVPSKAISRGTAVGVAAIKKDFRDAALQISAASKAISRGTVAGVRAVSSGAAVTALALTKELLRGTAVTVIPAAAVAACVWYFANRPPPKPQLAQPLVKAQASQPPKIQASPPPSESPVAAAIVPPPPQPAAPAIDTRVDLRRSNQAPEKTDESSRLELRRAPAPASVVQGSAPPESSAAAGAVTQLPSP